MKDGIEAQATSQDQRETARCVSSIAIRADLHVALVLDDSDEPRLHLIGETVQGEHPDDILSRAARMGRRDAAAFIEAADDARWGYEMGRSRSAGEHA